METPDRLRTLYDTILGPYLAAQDARVLATRRNRWIVLIGGLLLAAGVLALALRSGSSSEFGPMIAFGLAVGAVGYFVFSTASLADDVRHEMMARIATCLDLRYDAAALGFDLDRFALLGLAGADKITKTDRLWGDVDGLKVDMMAVRLADVSTSGIGDRRTTHTTERFTGLLVCVTDPSPSEVVFRIVPPENRTQHGMLRDVTIVVHNSSNSSAAPTMDELRAMMDARPESAPGSGTGDPTFDARFELHAREADLPAALRRLDPATRSALLDIGGYFDNAPVSIGFQNATIMFAFVTKKRFEIGALRPPMAEFGRVQHLADQMGILSAIAEKLRQAAAQRG